MDIQSSDLYISISKHHFLVNFLLQCDIIISIRNRNHFTYHTIPSFSRRRTGAERKNNHYSGSDEQNDEQLVCINIIRLFPNGHIFFRQYVLRAHQQPNFRLLSLLCFVILPFQPRVHHRLYLVHF